MAATKAIPGYLGAVAIFPYTNLLDEQSEFHGKLAAAMVPAIAETFPNFKPEDMLTSIGEGRLQTILQKGAGTSSNSCAALLSDIDALKPGWKENGHFRQHQAMTCNGGKAISGPLLVTHGEANPVLSATVVEKAVERTTELYPSSNIQYVSLPHVTYALAASQSLWMDWIWDRFAGRDLKPIGEKGRPASSQQGDQDWYLALERKS